MSGSDRARRIAAAVTSVVAVLLIALTGSAAAATTRIVAPGSNRMTDPCTTSNACNFVWAMQNSSGGDVVQFESGEYDYSPGNNSLIVPANVTLEPAPGATTRPLIKQTTGFTTCNCPTMSVGGTIDGLEIDQAAGASGKAAGAVDLGGTIEHSKLEGKFDGMYATSSGRLIDSSVIGRAGYGIWDENPGTTVELDNVTAISQATVMSGRAVGIYLTAAANGTTTLNATDTYARGAGDDVLSGGGVGNTDVTLHYSDAKMELAHSSGAGTATLTDTDHPMRTDAIFASTTDYTEAPGSPTIDAGTADPASGALDLLGLPRTVGLATDIGATEWQGAAPAVTTGPASSAGATSVTIAGTVNPEDLATTWHVDYGPTTAYGSQSATQTLAATTTPQAVTATLSGLTPGTTYHFRLSASNGEGPATGGDLTFAILVPVRDTTPPTISHVSLSHGKFAVAKRATAISARRRKPPPKGTSVKFTLSERATVTLTITEKLTGHRHGKRCVATKSKHVAKGSRCTLARTEGIVTRTFEPAGADTVSFSGRIGKRALKPGKYALQIDATDPSGNTARPDRLKFTIVKP